MVNIVGLSMVGSGEVGGGSANSSDLRRSGKQSQRAPCNLFSAADRLPEEFYGQPETAEKMLSVKFVPASYTLKGLFLRKNAVRNFLNT